MPHALKDKVRFAITRADPGRKLCFIGDQSGELDGHMHQAFSLSSGTVKIAH